tara:strand:+ start:1141 stop:1317 length:177 start_codon:yes stop_codon:yes gene_type:complete
MEAATVGVQAATVCVQAFAARFYEDEAAMAMADAAVAYVVGRVSSLTGAPLAESPAAR